MTARRALLALATLAATVVIAEGLLSLVAGRTLRELVSEPAPVAEWRAPTDDDLIEVANRNAGLYRAHEDPLVGYVMRRNAELAIDGVGLRTDALGLRVRPGGAAAEDALRIVVLGDSVAFGWGVADDETLAARIEVELERLRGPDATPPIACFTVAAPGWNHRNAVHFLLDHYDRFDPDIVLYMPISNDLANTYGIYETSHRRDIPDIATSDPWLRVNNDRAHAYLLKLAKRLQRTGDELDPRDLGPRCLNAALSPESIRRYERNVDSIALLSDVLERRGAELMLLQYTEGRYVWHLWTRMAERGIDLPVVPLLKGSVPGEFTLPTDPHPNPRTQDVMAIWCAEALVARGWIPGVPDGAQPSAVPEEYTAHRAPELTVEEWRSLSDEQRERDAFLLRSAIDVVHGDGTSQIYGGLNPDGSARRHLLAILEPAGSHLTLELEPLPERDDLYPIEVTVDVDDRPLETLVVSADGPVRARLALPSRADPAAPIEVRLRATRAVVTRLDRRSQLASYQLIRIACEDD